MGAELDYSSGEAAIVAVGKTPWHREGLVLATPPKTIEIAARLSHTDFPVEVRDMKVDVAPITWATDPVTGEKSYNYTPHLVTVPGHRAVVRMDTGSVLSVVGSDYESIQNTDAFNVLQPLLDADLATIETIGALRGGRDVWMLVRFRIDDAEICDLMLRGGEILPYGLVHTNHAGRATRCADTSVLVVCANTLRQTDGLGVRIVHAHGALDRLKVEAEKLWGSLIERYRRAAREQALFRRYKPMTQEQFTECVLDAAAPLPTLAEYAAHGFSPAQAKDAPIGRTARRQRDLISDLWEHGIGISGDRSAWEAYNAAVEALDHHAGVYRVQGSRVESLLTGRLGVAKQRVHDRLARLVTA